MGYLVYSNNDIESIVILDDNDDAISNLFNEEVLKKSIKELK